jgi:hypothetical protein
MQGVPDSFCDGVAKPATSQTDMITTNCTCTIPWGGTIGSGASVTAYSAASVIYPAACTSESRTCSLGVLSGTYTNSGCTVVTNGACGGTSNTCTAGSPSGYLAGSCGGSQTWTCQGANGGSNAACSIANAACINGACNGIFNSYTLPTATCAAGNPTSVSGSGPWTWGCNSPNGGTSTTATACSANKSVDG